MVEALNRPAEWPDVVTHLRIFQEADGAWSLDGFNENTGEYSAIVWTYDTFAEAVAQLKNFPARLEADGVRIEWRKPLHHHHWVPVKGSSGDMACAMMDCAAVTKKVMP